MHPFRILILTAGPLALIGLSYGASSQRGTVELREWVDKAFAKLSNIPEPFGSEVSQGDNARESSDLVSSAPAQSAAELESACRRRAEAVEKTLDDGCSVVVHSPFVVGGDGTEEQLKEAVDELILPIARTLHRCYFEKPPDQPIVILMFASGEKFQKHAQRLDGRRQDDYYGYYRREERRVMLNASTGGGTTAHELTHALAHCDFPTMPEWFDEGLASLHEEAQFSDNEDEITGLSNWRVNHLLMGLRRGKVRTLEEMISSPSAVRDEYEAIDYAHSRYFCLFLQQRGLLSGFYRSLRAAGAKADSAAVLRELIAPKSLEQLDEEFRTWCAKFRPISRRIPNGVRRS